MTITFDGERSKQRFGLARKWLGDLKMLGLPAKVMVHEGFTYRLSNLAEGLEGGRVTAPLGAVVLCSQHSGVKVLTADYWLSAFTPEREVHRNDYQGGGGDHWVQGYQAVVGDALFVPVKSYDTGFDLLGYTGSPPTPVPSVIAGERFWVNLSGQLQSGDNYTESFVNFYADSGKSEKRTFAGSYTAKHWYTQPVHHDTEFRAVSHFVYTYVYLTAYGNLLVCATYLSGGTAGNPVTTDFFLGQTMFAGLPAGLQSLLLQYPSPPGMGAIGNYAFALPGQDPTLLHACEAYAGPDFAAYYAANPTHEPLKLFFSIYTYGANTIATHPVNIPLLHSLAPSVAPGGVVNWDEARAVMWQLFGWPNGPWWAHQTDSVMFHAQDGSVYSWTRKYGGVRFSINGMTAAMVNVPAAVSANIGTRPEMYFAGNGVYVCVCTKNADAWEPGSSHPLDPEAPPPPFDAWNGVAALYVGSPFTAWTELPMPPVDHRLLHARVVFATLTEVRLLGVMYEVAEDKYYFAQLHWKGGTEEWHRLAPLDIQVDDVNTARWGVGVFGDDPMAKQMMEFPHPPPCLPQAAKMPYSATIGHAP